MLTYHISGSLPAPWEDFIPEDKDRPGHRDHHSRDGHLPECVGGSPSTPTVVVEDYYSASFKYLKSLKARGLPMPRKTR